MSTDARREETEQKKTDADRAASAWFAPTADDPAWRKTVRDDLAAAARKRGDKVLGPSLWPSKHTRRVRWLRWRWWVADPAVTNTLADGYALTEKWAWHKAGVAAARVYAERVEAKQRRAEQIPGGES
jgi:hypothetical protein